MLFRTRLVATSIIVLLGIALLSITGHAYAADDKQDSPFLPSEQVQGNKHDGPALEGANHPDTSPSDKNPSDKGAEKSATAADKSADKPSAEPDVLPAVKSQAACAAESDDLSFPSCDDWTYPACDPLWTVRADSMFLNRAAPHSETLLADNGGNSNFNANQFEFPIQLGWEIDLQCKFACNWAVEARFFDVGIHGASATAPQSATGAGVAYDNSSATGIFGKGAVNSSLSYDSRLQSVEINLRGDVTSRLGVLAGVRYFQMTDDIAIDQSSTSNLVHDEQQLQAYNGLIGFQIGGYANLWSCGQFSLDGDLRLGVYGDAARNHFSYNSDYYQLDRETGTHAGAAAFIGETSLRASYQLTERWSFVAGYEVLSLDGVALAYKQPSTNTSPVLGPATNVRFGGDVFYQGATAGLEFRR